MKKVLFLLFMGVTFLMPSSDYKKFDSVQSSFASSEQIEIINEGRSVIFDKGTDEYYSILFEFEKMIYGSHQMPAFGVSLDSLTREEMKKGLWVRFIFDGVNYNGDLPFESLLIQVVDDYSGFNVIREYEGKFDGRCFYIDLVNNTMDEFYLYLVNGKK